jgi:hypothetical protein
VPGLAEMFLWSLRRSFLTLMPHCKHSIISSSPSSSFELIDIFCWVFGMDGQELGWNLAACRDGVEDSEIAHHSLQSRLSHKAQPAVELNRVVADLPGILLNDSGTINMARH